MGLEGEEWHPRLFLALWTSLVSMPQSLKESCYKISMHYNPHHIKDLKNNFNVILLFPYVTTLRPFD